ncbi:MAG: chitobiase/beta-hexosaminidase C-terminal domain-containing protein [Firmicutes bacterium]|nr:chitobiase/beta-hexosaminidase C-terminal domain-containing protein [Bacillota bacterium]
MRKAYYKIIGMLLAVFITFNCAPLLINAGINGGPDDMNVHYSEDYEKFDIGNRIVNLTTTKENNIVYDASVQYDPLDKTNKVVKIESDRYIDSGNFQTFYLPSAPLQKDIVVYEQDAMHCTGAGGYTLSVLAYSKSRNQQYPVLYFPSTGIGTASQDKMYVTDSFRTPIQLDKWYRVRLMYNTKTSKMNFYAIDMSTGIVVAAEENREMTLLVGRESHSQGIDRFGLRVITGGVTEAIPKMYWDNINIYSVPSIDYAIELHNEDVKNIASRVGITDNQTREKVRNSLVVYKNSTVSYINGVFETIDKTNANMRCIFENNKAYLPLEFAKRVFPKADIEKKATSQITVNSIKFIELEELAESLEKDLLIDQNGVCIIGDFGELLQTDLDMLYDARYGINKPSIPEDVMVSKSENAEENAIKFANRNSQEGVKKAADELFEMLDLKRPEFAGIKKLYQNGEYNRALGEYKSFFAKKYKQLYEKSDRYIGMEGDLCNNLSNRADNLMFDYSGLQKDVDEEESCEKNTIYIDRPFGYAPAGQINWNFALPVKMRSTSYYFEPHKSWTLEQFLELLKMYNMTGNIAFADKWNDYIDDWALFEDSWVSLPAADHTDNDKGNGFLTAMYHLGMMEDAAGAISEVTFARGLTKLIKGSVPAMVMYYKSNPQNWTTGGAVTVTVSGDLLDNLGFKIGEEIFVDGIRRVEDFMTTHCMPDGTECEQNHHYNLEYLKWGMSTFKKFIAAARPHILTKELIDEWNDILFEKAKFTSFILYPETALPSGFRTDYRLQSEIEFFLEYFPEYVQNDDIRILKDSIINPSDNNFISRLAWDPLAEKPSFTSISFPYIGFNVFRSSWDVFGQFGYLYSTPHASNTQFRRSGSNIFVLRAFGQELITAGEAGMYDDLKSPLLVDGKEQNVDANTYDWGHRHNMVSAWDKPGERRWHTSEYFDVSEGIYDSFYGDTATILSIGQYGNVDYDASVEAQLERLKTMITDVAHQRQVNFLKEFGLWVVTDRMTAEKAHNYQANWYIPTENISPRSTAVFNSFKINPSGIYLSMPKATGVFKNNKITTVATGNEGFVKTSEPGIPNLSIYNFSTSPISYSRKKIDYPDDNSYKLTDYVEVQTGFGGEGEQLLINVMYPRETEGFDIPEIKQINTGNEKVIGFDAVVEKAETVSGKNTRFSNANKGEKRVQYVVASDKKQLLRLGDIEMIGESLMLATNEKGEIRGVALSAETVKVNGELQDISATDFEFRMDNGNIVDIVPIYMPLAEVEISPVQNVFIDEITVEMKHDAPNVEIRYTINGGEPTIESPLYTEPLTFSQTTIIRTKAFRKGLESTPTTADGVYASPARIAVFTKQAPKPAAKIDAGNLENGLNYKYYEGAWKDMFVNIYNMKPLKTGEADTILDISQKETEEPFGFMYEGYIKSEDEGVYTFYAPRDWLWPDVLAGYDIQIFIDGEMWYPTTRRQSFGTWSISLAKGFHEIKVKYIDYRGQTAQEYNREGIKDLIWSGDIPELLISGPNIEKQTIPNKMLYRNKPHTGEGE